MSSHTCVCVCVSQVRSELHSGVRSQVVLDVVSLAELQRLGVPHTDDSLKYQYHLDQDSYGTVPPGPGLPAGVICSTQTSNVSRCPPSVPSMPRHSPGSV